MIEPELKDPTDKEASGPLLSPLASNERGSTTDADIQNVGQRVSYWESVRRGVWNIPASIAIFLVRIYQWTLSPIIGRQCRFHPSCSNYYILAVRKYGFVSGSCRGFWRICRCNPFCRGGEDFP